jgi:DNA-binding NarL/FixJ family response regulator
MNSSEKTNIILVDDHKMLRNGLKTILQQRANFQIVGEASNGSDAIKLCLKLNPNVVITDISMQGLNGIEATKQIIKEQPEIKIIGLSMHANKKYVQSMFKAGGYGYLLKDGDSEELIAAITTVMENKKYLSKNINQDYLLF